MASYINPDETAQYDADFSTWSPKEHMGKVHLFASSGRIEQTPKSEYNETTSIADVIVVWEKATETVVHQNAYVGQAWFRKRFDGSGGMLLAGRLAEQDTSKGNKMFILENLNPEAADVVDSWIDENLDGSVEDGWKLKGAALAEAEAEAAAKTETAEQPAEGDIVEDGEDPF